MRRTTSISTLAMLGMLATSGLAAQAAPTTTKPAASQQVTAKPVAAPAASMATKPAHELLNLNTATRDQLVTLPGVGESYADAIIKARPFKSKSELVSRKVLPEAAYKKFESMVIAKHTA